MFYPKTNESLKEDIAEPTQETTSTESQKESGLTAVVNSLINDENEAISIAQYMLENGEIDFAIGHEIINITAFLAC